MSFPKAHIRRFNEGAGCAPPVGSYDPKDGKKAAGGVIERSERFKHPKDVVDSLSSALTMSNPSLCSTPIKGSSLLSNTSSASSDSLPHIASSKSSSKKSAQLVEHLSRVKELESEIRRLLREKSDRDKELQKLHQEQERLEGRLNTANAERSSCLARSAQLEQEVRDAKRGLDILQKQVSSTESCGRKKEERLKEEVQALQAQIHSKEREIQDTQRQIAHAMVSLITDTQQCASHSDSLTHLFSRLELNADVADSEDDDKVVAFNSDSGLKQFESQIRKVRRHIRCVSRTISRLAENGVERLDRLQARLEEEHARREQQLSEQLADTQTQHQELSHQLSKQEQEHRQRLQEQDSMQTQILELQQKCEQAHCQLQQTLQEHSSVEQQLRAEHRAALEERHAQRMREVGQLQEQLETALEDLMQKEARLGELQSCLLERQEEHDVATAALKDRLEGIQQQLFHAQDDLQHTQAQHQQAVQQLQESQQCRSSLQEQVALLQEEERRLKENRVNLELDMEMMKKELELKTTMLTEALQTLKGEVFTVRETGTPTKITQVLFEERGEKASLEERIQELEEENSTLDASIRALTAKFQASIQDLELALGEERKKVGQMRAWIAVLEEEQSKVGQELNQTQMVNRNLVDSLSSFRDELSSLKSASQELKEQLVEEKSTTTTLQIAIQETQQLLEEEKARNGSLQTTLIDTEKQIENANIANTNLQIALKKVEKELEEDRAANTDLKTAIAEAGKQLEEEKSTNTGFQTAIKMLEIQLEEGRMELKTMQDSLEQEKLSNTNLQVTITNIEEQLEAERIAKADLETAVRNTQNLLEEEKSAKVELQATMKNTEDQLEAERLSNCELQVAVRESELLVEQGRNSITDLRAQVKSLELQLEEQHAGAAVTLRETTARVEQLQVENKQHLIANEALKEKLTQLIEQHTKDIEQLQHKCQSLASERQRLCEKHQDDLQSVKRALALDREANDLQMDELNMKLDRAQAFNTQLKEEMKKLLKDNEKLKDDRKAEVTALQVRVEVAEAKTLEVSSQSDLLRHQAKHAQAEWLRLKSSVEELEGQLAVKEEVVGDLQARLKECHTTMAANEDRIGELMAEKESLEDHLNRLSEEHTVLESDLERQLETVRAAALEERGGYEKMVNEMSEKIQQLERELKNVPAKQEEINWQQNYQDLFARVEPFMEQLDAFAAEKNFLVGRSEMAEAEMARMMDKYAKLLGHQNQKQKIQYINRLKDEFMQCRKEKEVLKEKCNKQNSTIQKLEKKLQSLEGRKTFDPTQAFKHPKTEDPAPTSSVSAKHVRGQEDMVPRSPLKQSNK